MAEILEVGYERPVKEAERLAQLRRTAGDLTKYA